jgi:hypothetical protein
MHQPISSSTKLRVVRLNTGEDLVTELAYIEDKGTGNYYIFFNPLKIVYTLGERAGYLSVSLMQWMFPRIVDKQEFVIYPSDVLTIASPSTNMMTYYYASLERLNEVKFEYGGEEESEEELDEDEIKSEDITESDLDYVKTTRRGYINEKE